jgi:hypothetical protein
MTRYRRRGHYRRSRNGGVHWVSEHSVNRRSRSSAAYRQRGHAPRSSGQPFKEAVGAWPSVPEGPPPPVSWADRPWSVPELARPLLPPTQRAQPYSSRWAVPNGRCPVCSALVFFWWDGGDGEVAFDEIGPPWPMHPCAALARRDGRVDSFTMRVKPEPRRRWSYAAAALRPRRRVSRAWFTSRYGVQPSASAWVVVAVYSAPPITGVILRKVRLGGTPVHWVVPVPISLSPDDIVFIEDDYMTYINSGNLAPYGVPIFPATRYFGLGVRQRWQ